MKKKNSLLLFLFLFIWSFSWAQLSAIDDVLVGRADNPNLSNSSGDRIYFNDLFNGIPITAGTIGNFTMSEVVPDPTGFTTLNTAFGFVGIAANTPAGNYYITYEICENANPTNCDTAVIEIRIYPSQTSSGSGSFNLTVASSPGSINCSGDVCITNGGCIDQSLGTIQPITLSASYTEVGESNSYGVRSIPFNPPFSFGDTAGDTNLTTDDNWSQVIDFAFDFEFYQTDNTSCVLSTNGAVSFDLSNANQFHFWTPNNPIPSNTDAALMDGNIFGAIHDTDPSASGTIGTDFNITYGVKGVAPFRVFVFSFFNVAHFLCNSLKTSQMILFYESTNVIEVFMFQKPVCLTWAGGRAAIGIQNEAGTQGISPPGRNTNVYDITVPEAWQFYPNGTSISEFEWLDETGAVVGTDPNNLTVAPTTTTTYIAQITYTDAITGDIYVATRPITVVVQPTPVITLTSNNSVCTGGDAEFTITGSEGDVVDYNLNGGATEQVTLDATGIFVVTVSGISADQTLNLENVSNPNSGCNGALTQSVTVSVNNSGSAAFSMTPTCDGATAAISGTSGGAFTFNPVPTDGATIDSSTGTISNGVSGTTYTVEYTISGSCSATSSEDVTILLTDDASFMTTPTCDGGTVTISGTAGGTFTFNPVPTDGAVIDPTTGTVSGGTSGATYTIEYTTMGLCPDTNTEDVTALTTSNPSFTATPTCDGGTVTITGDAGGIFTFNPVPTDGATIDPTTGTVTGGTSGVTYTIEYTISGACGSSSMQDVTVLTTANASFTTTDTCDGGTVTITGDAGGTFAFNPVPIDGATIDPLTGTVTNGIPGTMYTIEYTISGSCGASSIQNITVLPNDIASFTTTPTCDGGTVTITGTSGGTFAFNPVPADGAVIDAVTGTVTGGVSGVTYTIEYTTTGICPATSTEDVTVLTTANPSFTTTPTCDGGTVTITGDEGGAFAFNPVPTDGAIIDAATGTIIGGISGTTYTIEYTISGSCGASSTGDVTVFPVEDPDYTVLENCDGGTMTIVGDVGGTFAFNPVPTDGAIIDTITGTVTGGTPGATYTVEYTTGGPCPESSFQNVTVLPADNASFTAMPTCDGGTVTITGNTGGSFTFNPVPTDGAIIDATTGTVTGGLSNTTYTIEYTTAGACPATSTQDVTVLQVDDASFTVTPSCFGGTVSITGVTGGTFTFNPLPTDGAVINSTTGEVTGGTPGATYTIEYTTNGSCPNSSTQNLNVYPLPIIPADAQDSIYEICDDTNDNDGFATFDLTTQNEALTGGDASLVADYYESMMDIPNNPISDYSAYNNASVGGLPYNPQTIFATVTETTSGSSCYALTTLTLVVNTLPTPNDVLPNLVECDNNNPGDLQEEFDLTQNEMLMLNDFDESVTYYESLTDAELGENAIGNATNYTNISTPQTIYVSVTNTGDPANPSDNGTGCSTIVTFDLIVNPLPVFIPDDLYVICVNTNGTEVIGPPIIDTGLNPTDYTFEWTDANGTVVSIDPSYTATEPGIYMVEITNIATTCFNVVSVEVVESSPPVVVAEVTTEAFADNPVIVVTATGDAAAVFEFSLDNGPWVSNDPNNNTYTFTNVIYGEHIITARDINGCGIGSDVVMVIDYPLFFTPNNDGDNDTWQISGINPDATIHIFDRYGKLLKQLSPTSSGWDGTLNGYPLPSSDYWFTVDYKESMDDNAMKQFRAHFTLKR